MTLFVLLLFLAQALPKPPAASIEGIVRSAGTGEPVFKAQVMLNGGSSVQRSANTDRDGRFSFKDLEAGRYTLIASANGYVRQVYGQKTLNGPSTPVNLAAGQPLKDVVFELMPTGTVSGRVYDFDNMPLASADVVLQKLAYDGNGQRTLQTVQQTRTNDLGEYRLFWVSPGKYFLRVDYTGAPGPGFRSPNDLIGPVEEGYVPIFYPGVSDAASATEIEVLPAAQLSAIDVTMIRTRTYTIRGRVIVAAANGASIRPFVSLMPRQMSGNMSGANAMNTSMNPADGTFEIRNVAAGSYILQANGGTPPSNMRAQRALDVNQDMDGVVITLAPGFDVPGRVLFEGGPPQPGPNAVPLTSMRAVLRPAGNLGFGVVSVGTGGPPVLKADGTFTITQVMPGTYQLLISPLPADYYVKAVTVGRTDTIQDGFTLERTPDTPIEVVVSGNAGKLEGTIVDKDDKPVTNAQVTLIPADMNRSDRYRVSFSDANGHFALRGIYPGQYRIFGWDNLEPNAYRDPEYIRRYENQGKVVVVTEGANSSVDLRVIKP